MTIITAISSKAKGKNSTAGVREPSEFDGLWINAGLNVGTEEEHKFARLPRGIAVSDLVTRKVYESMDPDFVAEVTTVNQMIAQIQAKALTLAEGESVPLNLELRLYRRLEEAEVTVDKATDENLYKILFG